MGRKFSGCIRKQTKCKTWALFAVDLIDDILCILTLYAGASNPLVAICLVLSVIVLLMDLVGNPFKADGHTILKRVWGVVCLNFNIAKINFIPVAMKIAAGGNEDAPDVDTSSGQGDLINLASGPALIAIAIFALVFSLPSYVMHKCAKSCKKGGGCCGALCKCLECLAAEVPLYIVLGLCLFACIGLTVFNAIAGGAFENLTINESNAVGVGALIAGYLSIVKDIVLYTCWKAKPSACQTCVLDSQGSDVNSGSS